jgi:DNA repair exonuclease SbcCD ATPase subunit
MGGIIFKNLIIKNGRVFDDVVIPLENQGLVSIQGDNGVGKSSIWDILEAIIYGSTPDGYKKDELTKNSDDVEYTLTAEKDGETVVATLQRKNKKWSYTILKDGKSYTDHTYYEAIKSLGGIVGLTKDEFEGSVHLTQSAQHMLIKGSLSERKDYISAFFGIDNRYDEVHLAAKNELESVVGKIERLAGLSHSRQMLDNELKNLIVKDIEPLQNKLKTLQNSLEDNSTRLQEIDTKIKTWQEFKRYEKDSLLFESPEKELQGVESLIASRQAKISYANQIQEQNKKAKLNNDKLDEILNSIQDITNQYPYVVEDTTPTKDYENELSDLEMIRKQNISVSALKKELEVLPNVKELPIAKIEEELVKLQVAYQTYLRNKSAKEKGICPECGSKFNIQDVQKDLEKIKEVKEHIELLSQDYQTIKVRNQNAKRRAWALEQLKDIPAFLEVHETRINYLRHFIQILKRYQELENRSKLLSRMPIEEIGNIEKALQDIGDLQRKKSSIERCMYARKMKPIPPKESEEDLLKYKSDSHNQILNLKTFINTTLEAIGEYKSINESHTRLTVQLKDIESKLTEVDALKKEEYFWGKMVDAYGPRGLRVQQLEKMMDLILMQLPVYVSILFNEKNLTFKHKVDANNVKILASREVLDGKGNVVNRFEHDIGCFSGGEKDLMSAAFILTLADCIPVNKRANILVLDEVDAQFDENIKFRFTNELLPMLKKKYSSIFVISHDKNVQLANIYDQIWSLSKKNHKSSIEFKYLG